LDELDDSECSPLHLAILKGISPLLAIMPPHCALGEQSDLQDSFAFYNSCFPPPPPLYTHTHTPPLSSHSHVNPVPPTPFPPTPIYLHIHVDNLHPPIVAEQVCTVVFIKTVSLDLSEGLEESSYQLEEALEFAGSQGLNLWELSGHPDAAQALIELGANLRLPCEGSPPLHLAVCSAAHSHQQDRAHQTLTILLDRGAQVAQRCVSPPCAT
jgi:hypothetical protein